MPALAHRLFFIRLLDRLNLVIMNVGHILYQDEAETDKKRKEAREKRAQKGSKVSYKIILFSTRDGNPAKRYRRILAIFTIISVFWNADIFLPKNGLLIRIFLLLKKLQIFGLPSLFFYTKSIFSNSVID